MPEQPMDIGIVTDEIAYDLEEAFEVGRRWGLSRFELRRGAEGRFPDFTDREIRLVEQARREGAQITAVSPGLLKGVADDEAQIARELGEALPRSLELAERFGCQTVILFGFERYEGEPEENRVRVLRAFERAAEQAAGAGMALAVENEPGFWVDRPAAEAALLAKIGHPALKANWDPANVVWGGDSIGRVGFEALKRFIHNLHVKDYTREDQKTPWRPVGQGRIPWQRILRWIAEETDLGHVTLETHCTPLEESSRQSLSALRRLLGELQDHHTGKPTHQTEA